VAFTFEMQWVYCAVGRESSILAKDYLFRKGNIYDKMADDTGYGRLPTDPRSTI